MSFSHNAKLEALEGDFEADCCPLAFLSAVFHSCGELGIEKGHFSCFITTDIYPLFEKCNEILKTLYGDACELEISDGYAINKKTYYTISFPISKSEELLSESGVLERSENGSLQISEHVPSYVTSSECCKKAFIKGAFVGCATTNIRISTIASEKTSNGYHLEFTGHNFEFLTDLKDILDYFNVKAKISQRKNKYVLYIKEASQVCDVLTIVGATSAVLSLENEIIARGMRNKINRETNCFSANISKTVSASMKQMEAIEKINKTLGLDKLSPELEEACLLRLANQEESLEELLKLSDMKISKSGLNHRFRKIIQIADKLN